MKKLSLIIVAIAVISLVACKKDRICTCSISSVTTLGTSSSTVAGTQTTKYTKVTKKEIRSKDQCATRTETSVVAAQTTTDTYTCTLSK